MTNPTPNLKLAVQNILSKPLSDPEKAQHITETVRCWLLSKEGMSIAVLAGYEHGLKDANEDDGK